MCEFFRRRQTIAILLTLGWLCLTLGCGAAGGSELPTPQATPTAPVSPQATSAQAVAATATISATTSVLMPIVDVQPTLPLRAAFYYPWFPEAWTQKGITPYSNYTPVLGNYDSSDPAIIRQHIAAMQYGNIQAGIASWWGQGTPTDRRIPLLLETARGSAFRWSIYYESEGSSNPTVERIKSDLIYIRDHYGNDPSFLRIDGRFVVFVYADATDSCAMAARWRQANTIKAYIVLKVFSDYGGCADQPDGWHQYAPAVQADLQEGYSYSISPGFWKVGENARLGRDLTRWYASIRDMVASDAPFQLITTFNEWGEGTAIEPAKEWASASQYGAYLDALHTNGEGMPPAATPQVMNVPTPTRVPPAPAATRAPTIAPPVSQPAIAPGADAVLVGAGDIACDPDDPNFKNSIGTNTGCHMKQTSDIIAELGKNNSLLHVFVAGDDEYENGDYNKFMQSYDVTWGRFKAITSPAVGNHEYLTPKATGYYQYFGAAAGDPTKGYYSYDLGAWHIVVVNSMCSEVGGCSPGSPQERWLRADLAAHPTVCTLAYWHHPRYSSGEHGNFTSMIGIWQALYDARAELVISGHDHDYERFAPQDANGVVDVARGLRQFVVGTGGKNHTRLKQPIANSEMRNDNTFGVLKLTLHANSYDWQFIPEPGKAFTDSGSAACH
jgi:glycosyl hydrolase family 99/calcineurin-like phosphoesterase family protein